MIPDELILAVPAEMEHLVSKAAVNGQLRLHDCAQLPFVVVGKHQEMRQLFDKLCSQGDFTPNISAEVVGISTAWAMATAGVGAALLPRQFVNSKQFNSNLVLYAIEDCTYIRQPAVVTRRGQYLPEYAKYAIGLLTEAQNNG
jgi:DNA-binding transcriptional LysR family regulator